MAINSSVIETSKKFIECLEQKNIHIEQAYIFGSQANDTAHPYSDIDLALISNAFSGFRFNDNVKIIKNTPNNFYDIETHPYRPEDFTMDNPLVEEILRTGIRII
jgi:predicted nucleotidyltransferase